MTLPCQPQPSLLPQEAAFSPRELALLEELADDCEFDELCDQLFADCEPAIMQHPLARRASGRRAPLPAHPPG